MLSDLPYRPLLLALTVLLTTACATHRHHETRTPAATNTANPEAPYPPTRTPVVGDILHLPTGLFVTEEEMLQIVTDARVVYIGETHDNPASHRQELAVLRALTESHPGEIALGMEMFTPAQQETLDRWSAGELSEKEFLRESRWYEVWRMDFDYYRDLLNYAREHAIPVIGLNAEKSLVQAVRDNDAAPSSPDLADPYHRALVEAVFGGHVHGEIDFEAFFQVQTLWDETMAEGVANYLEENPEKRMLVVAGANHVRYGFGIPRRAFRRLPHSYVLVGSREIEIPAQMEDKMMEIDLPSFPMPPYHFMAFTRYEDLGKERVRLGIMLAEEDGVVVVEKVLPGSFAEKAGLQIGDRIVGIDGETAKERFDLIYAVRQKSLGDRIVLTLSEEGVERDVEILFEAPLPDATGSEP
jgi:uncharacterized iron-regulated protein